MAKGDKKERKKTSAKYCWIELALAIAAEERNKSCAAKENFSKAKFL